MINNCQAGHTTHDRKSVETSLGSMVIYDWKKYMGFNGYCMGQDDISRTLENTGMWDAAIDARIRAILTEGNKENVFVDVGAHIGYFSMLAIQLGYKVEAYEGDAENYQLLQENAPDAKANFIWFNLHIVPLKSFKKKIELIKLDIEGSEQYAIAYFEPFIANVNNIIMEVSPTFNDSYPDLIEKLVNYGFKVFELDGTPFDFDYSFPQKDLWLKR